MGIHIWFSTLLLKWKLTISYTHLLNPIYIRSWSPLSYLSQHAHMPPHQRPTTTCMRKSFPLLVDLMHTFHLTTHATSSKVHSTCMKKSPPLRYATYIQNIFWLHNNQIQYIIFIFSFSSYIINSTMETSYNQITKIYCNWFPQQRAGYSLVSRDGMPWHTCVTQ